MAGMPVIVQTIHTRWTKASRGHPGSVRRNATPEVLDLPETPPDRSSDAALIWHDVTCGEQTFAPDQRCIVEPDLRRRFERISVYPDGDGLVVELFSRRCFVVRPGEIGTVVYNLAEDVIDDGWRSTLYHKVVFHLALGAAWETQLFRRPATHSHRRLRELA